MTTFGTYISFYTHQKSQDLNLCVGIKNPIQEFFEGLDEQLSGERQQLLTRLNLLAGSMDDQTLELFAKLGEVLVEDRRSATD